MDRRHFISLGTGSIAATCWPLSLLARDLVPRRGLDADTVLRCLAFGSCNDTRRDQSYWRLIGRDQPDLWLWLGDNIYADHLTVDQRQARYQEFMETQAYSEFRARVPVIGTWDDHDYAFDNADASYKGKADSQRLFLDFLGVSSEASVRSQEGIYQSYTYGPRGQQTQIIVLDLRSHMQRFRGQLLGPEQWAWLEDELRQSTADLRLIASSLNLTSPITGAGLEGWNEYPRERRRLYELLAAYSCPTIVMSGDRHFAEMSCVMLPGGQRVYEFMSSGLTHAVGVKFPHPGRLEEMVGRKNYGLLQIDWSDTGPRVRMQVKSSEQYAIYREHIADFSAE